MNSKLTADLPEIKHRASRANRIWLVVYFVVLVLLWLETNHGGEKSYNLFLSGNSALAGARVTVDGQDAGTMDPSPGSVLGGAVFYGHVTNGTHKIQVSKQGSLQFSRDVDVHGEAYLDVDLKHSSI
jgi:hypothetical protein